MTCLADEREPSFSRTSQNSAPATPSGESGFGTRIQDANPSTDNAPNQQWPKVVGIVGLIAVVACAALLGFGSNATTGFSVIHAVSPDTMERRSISANSLADFVQGRRFKICATKRQVDKCLTASNPNDVQVDFPFLPNHEATAVYWEIYSLHDDKFVIRSVLHPELFLHVGGLWNDIRLWGNDLHPGNEWYISGGDGIYSISTASRHVGRYLNAVPDSEGSQVTTSTSEFEEGSQWVIVSDPDPPIKLPDLATGKRFRICAVNEYRDYCLSSLDPQNVHAVLLQNDAAPEAVEALQWEIMRGIDGDADGSFSIRSPLHRDRGLFLNRLETMNDLRLASEGCEESSERRSWIVNEKGVQDGQAVFSIAPVMAPSHYIHVMQRGGSPQLLISDEGFFQGSLWRMEEVLTPTRPELLVPGQRFRVCAMNSYRNHCLTAIEPSRIQVALPDRNDAPEEVKAMQWEIYPYGGGFAMRSALHRDLSLGVYGIHSSDGLRLSGEESLNLVWNVKQEGERNGVPLFSFDSAALADGHFIHVYQDVSRPHAGPNLQVSTLGFQQGSLWSLEALPSQPLPLRPTLIPGRRFKICLSSPSQTNLVAAGQDVDIPIIDISSGPLPSLGEACLSANNPSDIRAAPVGDGAREDMQWEMHPLEDGAEGQQYALRSVLHDDFLHLGGLRTDVRLWPGIEHAGSGWVLAAEDGGLYSIAPARPATDRLAASYLHVAAGGGDVIVDNSRFYEGSLWSIEEVPAVPLADLTHNNTFKICSATAPVMQTDRSSAERFESKCLRAASSDFLELVPYDATAEYEPESLRWKVAMEEDYSGLRRFVVQSALHADKFVHVGGRKEDVRLWTQVQHTGNGWFVTVQDGGLFSIATAVRHAGHVLYAGEHADRPTLVPQDEGNAFAPGSLWSLERF